MQYVCNMGASVLAMEGHEYVVLQENSVSGDLNVVTMEKKLEITF